MASTAGSGRPAPPVAMTVVLAWTGSQGPRPAYLISRLPAGAPARRRAAAAYLISRARLKITSKTAVSQKG